MSRLTIVGVVRHASVGAVACIGLAWGCHAGSFACTDDTECAGTGTLGFCEDSGYCSFDDDTCPSSRRYGMRAPSELAGECVAPGPATSVADDDGSADDDASASTSGASSVTSFSTTSPVDPGDSTGDQSTSTASDAPGDASSSGALDDGTSATMDTGSTTDPPPPPCMPVFVDDFEDGVLDPEWGSWSSAECSFAETDGHLELTIGASMTDWVSAGLSTQFHPFLGGQVRAELVPFTPPIDVVGVWLTIYDPDGCEIQIAVENSSIIAMSAGAYFDVAQVDSEAPVWLQLRVDDDMLVHWEWSSDGDTWAEVHSEVAPCDFTTAQSAIFAGDMQDSARPIVRAVESYELCEGP